MAGPDGGPAGEDTTLVMLVQRTGTGLTGRVGYASAISVVVFVVTLVLMLLVLRRPEGGDVSVMDKVRTAPEQPAPAPAQSRGSPTSTADGYASGNSPCATCCCSAYWP